MLLNYLFRNNDVHGVLEKNDYRVVDMVFLIIKTYFNHATGSQNDTNMTAIHIIYSGIVSKVRLQNYGHDSLRQNWKLLRRDICEFQQKNVNMF